MHSLYTKEVLLELIYLALEVFYLPPNDHAVFADAKALYFGRRNWFGFP